MNPDVVRTSSTHAILDNEIKKIDVSRYDYGLVKHCCICDEEFEIYNIYDMRMFCPECGKRLKELLYPEKHETEGPLSCLDCRYAQHVNNLNKDEIHCTMPMPISDIRHCPYYEKGMKTYAL